MLDIVRIFEAIAIFIDSITGGATSIDWGSLIFRLRIFSALLSVLFIVGIAYTVTQLFEINKKRKLVTVPNIWADLPAEKRLSKWDGVTRRMKSESAADWSMAIIEADSIMDDIMKRIGYRGESFGERLKNIEPSDFDSLQDIWEAHKVRNRIAHEGANFKISRDEALRTVKLFEKGLKELEYIS
jgi:hypothetical protein